MLGSQEDVYPEKETLPESGAARTGVRLLGLLGPGQRFLLSLFLFLDVCVICFGCLLLFDKIGLPF